jgi:SAM-dependent methyltransferase
VTGPRFGSTAAFSITAADYAATMAPAIAPVAAEVVRRAALRPGETVLDIGTGTGTAAGMARGDGRRVIGLDGAPGMLNIARREVAEAEFIEGDFSAIPLDDGSVDALLAVHALIFATDPVATLREWRRVTSPTGRMVVSIPGPGEALPGAIFSAVYEQYGIEWRSADYPDASALGRWAADAGWIDIEAEADPTQAIPLADEAAFHAWLRVGRVDTRWDPDTLHGFARDLMAIAPRDADGGFRLPFGAVYLAARNPA